MSARKIKAILISIIVIISNLNAQDRYCEQREFNIMDGNMMITKLLSSSDAQFKQNKFMIGWHWCNQGREMTKALNMNQSHGWIMNNNFETQMQEDVNAIHNVYDISGDNANVYAMQAQSIEFEPTLIFNAEPDPNQLKTNPNDSHKPVFGFKNKDANLTVNTNDEYLHLDKNAAYVNKTILSNPWDLSNICFKRFNQTEIMIDMKIPWTYYKKRVEDKDITLPAPVSNFNGTHWVISIRLKRNNDITNNNSPILKIKLPYIIKTQGTFIKFSKLPQFPYVSKNHNSRGLRLVPKVLQSPSDEFVITSEMLPADGSTITISAEFYCFQNETDYGNVNPPDIETAFDNGPIPENWMGDKTDRIKDLGIDIDYLGNCNVDIDWIKLSTPHAYNLLWGEYDDAICKIIQSDIDQFNRTDDKNVYKSNNINLYRIYMRDEPNVMFWQAFQYFYKLVGDIGTTSMGAEYPVLYDHYVNPPEHWFQFFKIDHGVSAPYFTTNQKVNNAIVDNDLATENDYPVVSNYFGLVNGRDDIIFNLNGRNIVNNVNNDIFTSQYETSTRGGLIGNELEPECSSLRLMANDDWRNSMEYRKSFQAAFDSDISFRFTGWSTSKNSINLGKGFLFSDKIWWAQNFIGFIIEYYPVDNQTRPFIRNIRPKTSEEINAITWLPIILGAKGLIYDRESSEKKGSGAGKSQIYYNENNLTSFGINPIANDPNERLFQKSIELDFLLKDEVGEDFLHNDDIPYFDNIALNLDYNNAVNYMGIKAEDGIYIGQKSTRFALRKIHDWINENSNELMNLKLVSWHGSGFRIFDEYDEKNYDDNNPNTNDNPIYKLIDVNNITTHKMWDQVHNSNFENFELSKDEAGEDLYDITILRNSSNTSLDDVFYIGVLNRRTDPIVLVRDEDEPVETFVSGADFYTYSKENAENFKNHEWTYWRDAFWKKRGCRIIRIPFNPNNFDITKDYLKITELGADNDFLNSSDWRKREFYHKVDTSMYSDGILSVRLQPGEGKIMKVEVIRCSGEFEGSLRHSNQRKIVAFPIDGKFNPASGLNLVRYHMVYEKYDPASNKNFVYYRRSFPVSSVISENQDACIPWENPLLISEFIIPMPNCEVSPVPIMPTVSICPSIVVRKGNGSIPDNVHIVYQCYKSDFTGEYPTSYEEGCIVEHKFSANSPIQSGYNYGIVLTHFSMPNRNINIDHNFRNNAFPKWGTPMINASEECNYYTWSDSLAGIGIAYKYSNDRCLNGTKYISYYTSETSVARHPSLNSYSPTSVVDPTLTEDRVGDYDCALVWQEANVLKTAADLTKNSSYQIFYTRLRKDPNGFFSNYLPPKPCNSWYNCYILNNAKDIAQISFYNGRQLRPNFNFYPTVYRNIDIYSKNPSAPPHMYHEDLVYWEGKNDYFQKTAILYQSIGHIDEFFPAENNGPNCWDARGALEIASTSFDLSKPSASHGIIKEYFEGNKKIYTQNSDSSNTVNFMGNNNIFQIRHGYFSFMSDWQGYLGNFETYKYTKPIKQLNLTDLGIEAYDNTYVHLMAAPYTRDDADAKLNRRLINVWALDVNMQNRSVISPSVAHLFKPNGVETKYYQIPTFGFRDDSLTYFISPIVISKESQIVVPKLRLDESRTKIVSDWFEINEADEFTFLSSSKKNRLPKGDLFIEKQSNGLIKKIPLTTSDLEGKHKKHNYKFINSQDTYYRFVWESKLSPQNYSEILFIEPESDELNIFKTKSDKYKKSNEYQLDNIINLAEFTDNTTTKTIDLVIHPNPAKDDISLTPYLASNMQSHEGLENITVEIEITSVLGNVLAKLNTRVGHTIKYSTSDYPSGYYYIKTTFYNEYNELVGSATNRFIITR